ncbi:PUA-like domain-containing protein [Mycena floridula]|nr:PUA-like domain-containing protein [Mycena floridula]
MEARRQLLMNDENQFPQWAKKQDNVWTKAFGPVKGVEVGAKFSSRQDCYDAGVHKSTYAGICAKTKGGGMSICLSNGYDNQDFGDRIVYIGTGGRNDPYSGVATRRQVEDQSFDHRMNKNLRESLTSKLPIRVVRGPNPASEYAPVEGYRYDGLYRLLQASEDKNEDGLTICKFYLERLPNQPPIPVKAKY